MGPNLVIGNGLKPLLFLVQLAFSKLYPDNTIIHLKPHWVSYKEQTQIIGAKSIVVDNYNNWQINLLEMERRIKYEKGPKLLFLNNPNNPSGKMVEKKNVIALAHFCEKHNIIVLSDDIYNKLIYTKYKKKYTHISKFYNKVISCASLSKVYACGGYRFGCLQFNECLKELCNMCKILASSIYSCPSILFQYVALEALTNKTEIPKYINFQLQMFETITTYVKSKAKRMKLTYSNTNSSWYILLCFSENYKEKLIKNNIHNSEQLCETLINMIGLITIPGSAFSIKPEYFVLRYSCIDIQDINIEKNTYNFNNIKKGLQELELWLNNLE